MQKSWVLLFLDLVCAFIEDEHQTLPNFQLLPLTQTPPKLDTPSLNAHPQPHLESHPILGRGGREEVAESLGLALSHPHFAFEFLSWSSCPNHMNPGSSLVSPSETLVFYYLIYFVLTI